MERDFLGGLVVRTLSFWVSKAGSESLIPGWGAKIPHAEWHSQKTTTKKLRTFQLKDNNNVEKTVNSGEQHLISVPEASSSGSWSHSFPCLRHLCTFRAPPAPDPPWNSLTLPSPVPYWNPSKTSPDFIILWSFSWCLCHVLSLTHLVAPHARTSLSRHRGEGVPASPLRSWPRPSGWVRCTE